jgi:hypothetical protein
VLADGRTVITVSVGEKVALAARVTALGTATDTTMPGVADGSVPRLATLISRIAGYRPLRRLLRETGELLEALVGTDVGDLDAAIAELEALHPAFSELLTPLFATTIAPTRLHGSPALNVMPARARCADRRQHLAGRLAAVRVLPGLLRRQRSRRGGRADHPQRLHGLASDARGVRHRRLRRVAGAAHSVRGGGHRRPRRRRADPRRRPGLRTRFHIEACRAIGALR